VNSTVVIIAVSSCSATSDITPKAMQASASRVCCPLRRSERSA
jgi:hypothetical protein